MPGRRQLPDVMGDALGRLRLAPRQSQELAVSSPGTGEEHAQGLLEKMMGLRLGGMARALEEQARSPQALDLAFEERLGPLLDREMEERRQRRRLLILKRAGLRYASSLDDIDYHLPRGLDPGELARLAQGDWVRQGRNLLITGPVGVGKTFVACALARALCLNGFSVLYCRAAQLAAEMSQARRSGSYQKAIKHFAKYDLLVVDDWGLEPLERRLGLDLLELVDARSGAHSFLLASPLPQERWAEALSDPTLAEALLDRLVQQALVLTLKGESLRATARPPLPQD